MTYRDGFFLFVVASCGCGVALDFDPQDPHGDGGVGADASLSGDLGAADASRPIDDGGVPDAGRPRDAGAVVDAGAPDAMAADSGVGFADAGAADAGAPECVLDTDCPSPALCTVAACVAGSCVLGARDCDDGDACTNDGCTPATGMCLHRAVVCDDANMCTIDACDSSSGSCSNATVDADDDGQSPASLGMCGLDCDDMNASVFHGQPLWFTSAYTTPLGTSSFDYDCSSRAEFEFSTFTFGPCMPMGAGCTPSGWVFSGTSMLPVCGAVGTYRECVFDPAGGTCMTILHDSFVQGCH